MIDRETTKWVTIDTLVAHPNNANVMPNDMLDILERNIVESGKYPPIIVRSLESSMEYVELHKEGKLQVIDGWHRLLVLQRLGQKEVHVDIWPGISDDRIKILLLTLNNLRGKDDNKKHNQLIRDIMATFDSAEDVAEMIPETVEQIQNTIDDAQDDINDAIVEADNISTTEALTVFCNPDQKAVINTAIKSWLNENDPDYRIEECREGYALSSICAGDTQCLAG